MSATRTLRPIGSFRTCRHSSATATLRSTGFWRRGPSMPCHLNMFYGATGYRLSLPERDRTVWDRMQGAWPGVSGQIRRRRTAGARNLRQPTYPPTRRTCRPSTTQGLSGRPETAVNQLDYAFASRGFHEKVSVRAMNHVGEWVPRRRPSDHCRLMIEVKTKADCG